jgi:phage tail sheath gpL-like
MPCDTRISTSVVELAKADRARLASVLAADGWTVTLTGAIGAQVLVAAKGGMSLRVAGTDARLTTGYGDNADDVTAAIRRAYAARTVADVSRRFGFKQQGSPEQLLGGAQRLLMRR